MEQGPDRDFAFHTLGWYQFQALTVSILQEVLGQTVEVAASGKDAGIDAFFRGTWKPISGEAYTGTFVAQAKYSRYAGKSLTEGLLAKEIPKLITLVKDAGVNHYFVLTNHVVSFERKLEIERHICNSTGLQTATIYGPDQLTAWIKESSRLRMMVPRVYGLGDLSEIVDQRARLQARAILDSFNSRLRTVVPTDAYRRAANALDEHRFVLLIGDPMTGKTTISYALALAALDHAQLSVFIVKSPSEFIEHWNPDDPKRFFWVDDVFGQTQLDRGLTFEWTREFDRLQAAIDRGARFIFTTRTYIWNDAKLLTKRHAFPLIDNSQVHIHVENLTKAEKCQILYHHVRMGEQTTTFKKAIHPYLKSLTDIRNFLPEAARRLGSPFFTNAIPNPPSEKSLREFFEKPLPILIDIIRQLEVDAKALLAIMFARGGSLPAPLLLTTADREFIELMGSTPEKVLSAVATLNENLIRRVVDFDGNATYVFVHPTVRDALASITGDTPDWLRIYLAGVDFNVALGEVSCGNLGLHGVRVIVPPSEFDSFLRGFRAYSEQPHRNGPDPLDFLATRCSKAFLALVVESYPNVLQRPNYRYERIASEPWLALMATLNDCNLLDEELRNEAVRTMVSASEEDISFAQDAQIMKLFTEVQREECLERIRDRYIPRLPGAIESHAENYEPSYGVVEDYFGNFAEYCDAAKELFADDWQRLQMLSKAEKTMRACIDDLEERYAEPEPDDDRGGYGLSETSEPSGGESDVFEDVADPN